MKNKEEIIIDVMKYKENNELSLAQFVFLYSLYQKDYDVCRYLLDSEDNILISWLQEKLYIKITGNTVEDIFPRQKTLDIFQSKDEQNISVWVEQWIELWPKGVKSGGYYVKSNKEDCLKKMIKFLKVRKYSKVQIFKATQNYIDRKARENYAYMMKAEYFIEKDGVSALATEISNIGEEEESDWTRSIA